MIAQAVVRLNDFEQSSGCDVAPVEFEGPAQFLLGAISFTVEMYNRYLLKNSQQRWGEGLVTAPISKPMALMVCRLPL